MWFKRESEKYTTAEIISACMSFIAEKCSSFADQVNSAELKKYAVTHDDSAV